MRSESLRRRAAAAAATAASNEFQHPRDIDSPEEPDADALAKLRKSLFKGGNETNDDSALASSIDDCLTSDSNNGASSTKDQVIYKPISVENDELATTIDIADEKKNGENEEESNDLNEQENVDKQMVRKQISYEGSASTHTSSVDSSSSTDTENTTESKRSAESEPELKKNKPTLRKSNLSYDGEKEEKARKQQRRISFTLT